MIEVDSREYYIYIEGCDLIYLDCDCIIIFFIAAAFEPATKESSLLLLTERIQLQTISILWISSLFINYSISYCYLRGSLNLLLLVSFYSTYYLALAIQSPLTSSGHDNGKPYRDNR